MPDWCPRERWVTMCDTLLEDELVSLSLASPRERCWAGVVGAADGGAARPSTATLGSFSHRARGTGPVPVVCTPRLIPPASHVFHRNDLRATATHHQQLLADG